MIKETQFLLTGDVNGETFLKDLSPNSSFVKSAEVDNLELPVKKFISEIKQKPGKTYLLINAMGGSDKYGPNLNADWFSSQVLKEYHKTFETFGHVYRHHKNKDPKVADGRVIFSHYNEKMHRVELVVEIDNDKAKDIIEKLDRGELVATSMAAKVSKDFCSLCNHAASRREDYCVHLKYYKNKINTPETPIPGAKKWGQKVYAINLDPKFFDISFVTIPADSTSSTLTKIASLPKEADIIKNIVVPINADLINKTHGSIPREVLKKLASKYSVPDIMSTMMGMSMFPSAKDYQYLHLVNSGLEKEAEFLYNANIIFQLPEKEDSSVYTKVANANFSDTLAEELLPYASEIGLGKPLVLSRILTKEATKYNPNTINSIPYLGALGASFYGYNKLLAHLQNSHLVEVEIPPAAKSKILQFMIDRPGYIAAGVLGAGYALNQIQNKIFSKQASLSKYFISSAIISPLVFLAAAQARKKSLEGETLSPSVKFLANHPYESSLTSTLIAPNLKRLFIKRSSMENYLSSLFLENNEEFNRIYNEIL